MKKDGSRRLPSFYLKQLRHFVQVLDFVVDMRAGAVLRTLWVVVENSWSQ